MGIGAADPGTPPFQGWLGLLRHIAVGGIAGVASGLIVGGVGGRVFMRIAGAVARDSVQGATTEAGFRVGEVSVGGTIALIVFIGLISGAVGAVFYLALRPWLAWAGRWRGVAFGIVLFAATSATSDMLNPDNIDFIVLRNEVLLVSLISLMFLGYGVMIDWLFGVFDRVLPPPEQRYDPARFFYMVFVGMGLLAASFVPVAMFTRDSCTCDPPYPASFSFLIVVLATGLWWLTAASGRMPTQTTAVARVLGYAGIAGLLAFGLLRAVSDAATIIT